MKCIMLTALKEENMRKMYIKIVCKYYGSLRKTIKNENYLAVLH